MARTMTGAEIVLTALADQGVEAIFGYPGGARHRACHCIFLHRPVALFKLENPAGP